MTRVAPESGTWARSTRSSEGDEVSVGAGVCLAGSGSEDDPLVVGAFHFLGLARPFKVLQAEVHRRADAGQLYVVHEDDAALLQQPSRVDQVQEHALEAVVAI